MTVFGEIPGKSGKNCWEFKKNILQNNDFWWYSINLGITCWKYYLNFQENSWDIWNQLVEVLVVFWWNFEKTSRKFWRNLIEIKKDNFWRFLEKYRENRAKIVLNFLKVLEVLKKKWFSVIYDKFPNNFPEILLKF